MKYQAVPPTEKETLPRRLQDWVDWDGAAYWLAVSIFPLSDEPDLFPTRAKHILWSATPVGEMLFEILDQMATAGILETRDEPDRQYRWNPSFRGTWETGE